MAPDADLYFGNAWQNPVPLTEHSLPPILLALVVEALLYGMHAVLFVICVRCWFRQRHKLQTAIFAAVVVMFILATADVAISWNVVLRHTSRMYTRDTGCLAKLLYPKFILHLINNFIDDSLLVLRCYVVWGSKKIILYTAGSVLVVGTIFGTISVGTTSSALKKFIGVYVLTILGLNVVVTILTAGRIFWIAKGAKNVMDPRAVSNYHFAAGILIESGLLYTCSTLLAVGLSQTPFVIMAAAIVIRLVCIMPILIIVQVTIGQCGRSVRAIITKTQDETHDQIILDSVVISIHHDSEETTHY